MEVWGAHVPEPARVCARVYEALDIKANFNKVWRQAGGTGETCQAQTLSLCVQSHPVFTSSGQLAACSVCWTAWQSHIFHHEFYMNINNLKKIHGCHRKTAHTMYVANSTTSNPQYYWTELWQWDGVLEILRRGVASQVHSNPVVLAGLWMRYNTNNIQFHLTAIQYYFGSPQLIIIRF